MDESLIPKEETEEPEPHSGAGFAERVQAILSCPFAQRVQLGIQVGLYLEDRALDVYFVWTLYNATPEDATGSTPGGEWLGTAAAAWLGLAFLLVPVLCAVLYVLQEWRTNRRIAVRGGAPPAAVRDLDRRLGLTLLASPLFGLIPALFPSLLETPHEILALPGLGAVSNAITLLTTDTFFTFASLVAGSFPMLQLQMYSRHRLGEATLSWLFCAKLCSNLLLTSSTLASRIVSTPPNTSMSAAGTPFLPPLSPAHEAAVRGLVATDCFVSLGAFTVVGGLAGYYSDHGGAAMSPATWTFLAALGAVKAWRVGYHLLRLIANKDWLQPFNRPHSTFFHVTPRTQVGRVWRLVMLTIVSLPFDFVQHYTKIFFTAAECSTVAHRSTKIMFDGGGIKAFAPLSLLLGASTYFAIEVCLAATASPNLVFLLVALAAGAGANTLLLAYYSWVMARRGVKVSGNGPLRERGREAPADVPVVAAGDELPSGSAGKKSAKACMQHYRRRLFERGMNEIEVEDPNLAGFEWVGWIAKRYDANDIASKCVLFHNCVRIVYTL